MHIILRNSDQLDIPFARLSSSFNQPLINFPTIWIHFEVPNIKILRYKLEFNFELRKTFLKWVIYYILLCAIVFYVLFVIFLYSNKKHKNTKKIIKPKTQKVSDISEANHIKLFFLLFLSTFTIYVVVFEVPCLFPSLLHLASVPPSVSHLKGIVSRDWVELQMIPVDSLEVRYRNLFFKKKRLRYSIWLSLCKWEVL